MATSTQYGAFVPTNLIWDVQQLQSVDVNSPEFKELLVRLYQNINNIALVLNIKDTGMYQLSEFVNGQLFFPNPANSSQTAMGPINRPVFRTVVNMGALKNAGTTQQPHKIAFNSGFTVTRMYGAASDTTDLTYIPIPYSSATLLDNIEMNADATNVYFITAADYSSYNISYAVIEYIKS